MNKIKDPGVSVVITTYNRASMVGRAILSVLNQTYKDFELIVVDDCSTDNTEQVVNVFHDSRLRYIRHDQNRRLPAARNTGIVTARGKYIAFLDDDDEWKTEKLQKQVELANTKSSEYGVIYCGALLVNAEGKTIGKNEPKLKGNIRSEIVRKGLSTIPSTFLFTKEALENVGGFDEKLESHTDYNIWMKMAEKDYYTDYVMEALVIAYQDVKDRMMADVEPRLRATEMYLEKWHPVIEEWLGEEEGRNYCSDYYANVVGSLGIESFKRRKIKKGAKCFYKIIRHNPTRARDYLLITRLLIMALINKWHLYPFVRKVMGKR